MSDTTVDWAAVKMLLDVVDLARLWPPLKALHDEALDALNTMNADVAKARAKRAADAKAKADADAWAAKMKADAEAEAEVPKSKPAAEPKLAPTFGGKEKVDA